MVLVISSNIVTPSTYMAYHFLFDLDGLLVNSEPLQLASYLELAKKYHVQDIADFQENYIGKSASDNLSILFPDASDERITDLKKEKSTILIQLIDQHGLQLMPGVKNLLLYTKFLSQKNGGSVQIVSSSSREYIEYFLNTTGILNFFDFLTSREEVKNGKPAPDIYFFAAQKALALPKDCIAFEDTLAGAQSAQNAGITVVGVLSDPKEKESFDATVDYSLKSLKECTPSFMDGLISKI